MVVFTACIIPTLTFVINLLFLFSTEDMRDEDDKRGKPKGVKKFSRLARSLAAAVISVID